MTSSAWARQNLFVLVLAGVAGCGGVHPVGGTDGGPGDATPGADLGPSDAPPGVDLGPRDGGGIDTGPGIDSGGIDSGVTDSGVGVDAAPDPVPLFRNPLTTPDDVLARQALALLGAPEAGATTASCRACHTISRARINYWRSLSDTSMSSCLTDLAVTSDASAAGMMACLRDPSSGAYKAARLGIWSTAATLPWFQYVFRHGTPPPPTGDWMTDHDAFVIAAGMPRTGTPFTQAEFDIVAEWFLRGVPNLNTVLPVGALPTTCLPGVSAEVVSHVAEMATTGWAARNAAAGMLMHGCAGATTPAGCLSTYPTASTTTYGANWETVADGVAGAHLRVLYTTTYESSWWTRPSPDGRFVSHGAATAPNLRFIDLAGPRVFGGDGLYDTSFFPDGSGFAIQGSSRGARVCENRVLTTGTPTMLTFTEPGCSSGSGIGLYEHLGTSLDGADYWAISGTSTYDNGGHSPTLSDPIADFRSSASTTITRLVNTGTSFTLGSTSTLAHPYEGDAVLSPSLTVLLTRQAGATTQEGYVLHRLDVTTAGTSFSVTAPEIGRYCINGGKPEFSFDERWMVIHHYIGDADAVELGFTGPSDPGFAAYRTRGAANVYLVNLTNGAQYRVTNMAAGQYALFPSFRSDGWIIFQVRDEASTPEHVVASDAALLAP